MKKQNLQGLKIKKELIRTKKEKQTRKMKKKLTRWKKYMV